MKYAFSDMKSAARPRNETTRLRALATGLRLMITAAPKISVISAKSQKRNGDIIDCGLRITDCGKKSDPNIDDSHLEFGDWQSCSFLLIPLQHDAMHDSADFEQLLFVMHHFRAREASDGIILAQINRLLGANLLAHPAENAADHIDIELLRIFLDFGEAICGGDFAGNDFDRTWRTDEFAELTRHA